MPELPEMETYRNLFSHNIINKPITDVEINREKSINKPVKDFISHVQGKTISSVKRRAKHLIFELNSGQNLLLHLMLGGSMFLGEDRNSPDRTKQVILSFGDLKLYFIGLRLGYLHLLTNEELEEKMTKLGPEPLSLSLEDFDKMISKKTGGLKPILVDQKFIAGIGNCYSDEIGFEAKLHPLKKAKDLTGEQRRSLYRAIKTVLKGAIDTGGYMDHPMYEGDEKTGGYNDQRLVYEREGKNCFRCGTKIERVESSTLKSFYCPSCQR
ncbi:DNA-formamidopyrimidine glycosylase [Fictibacillus phosphorivorans]|uniref:DNA-formamidopyrimidine glycosylase n=1 Tax=Fictibacillus phosphorivorans TaxID=1221500 RepID=UPI00203FF362|nr:DNA-formamidopyrimidine glycosylase [Fictibacillus phosphorivorans]MCM3718879.1 DNA-formamidopyrimidine glycosylase [Fictibacillus phosphorivorans]MCM3776501.1 DNA-formamidopyrimidine glycosylase [Fictibacillus phosphorivorans]